MNIYKSIQNNKKEFWALKEKGIRELLAWAFIKLGNLMLRLRGWYYCNLIKALGGECAGSFRVGRRFSLKFPPHKGIRIGYGVMLGKDVTLEVARGAFLTLGNNVYITQNTIISVSQSVHVGDNALVGEYTSIRDSDHGIQLEKLIKDQPLIAKPVIIGNDVWIGRGVAVLKGVHIGNGAVIGANSVVTRGVPPYSVVAGNPARRLKMRK